ncbi:membrane protein insertase YidC [Carnobacteriaceae bacterium zg-84]|uniref:membrane protein insertase YidC n=1 Tax=Granulicatella sp. zg-84 TaxID=2678503 RepID=UPI0013BFEE8B|nr:membrane protein insertase YidC [Granulicatella sp. zg-84]NEW66778.1 membrane protein insertase YidC [Granulicatella sp. zg-84]QMI85352.1 membrane protein insertase YidC [Carnobacteriaceae bacterium zg-84]
MKEKKWIRILVTLTLVLILSGCVGRDTSGAPTGFIWDVLGRPMEQLIFWFAGIFGNTVGSYGLGIIAVTILVRIAITPLNINMMKTNTIQQERMAYIRPQMQAITEEMRQAKTFEEQARLRQEQAALQKAAGIQFVSASGCLPLFIQMPIFSALYFATISSTEILNDTFLGVSLATPSWLFCILSSAFYLIQGYISQIGMTEEQKQMNKAVLFTTPLINLIFGLSLPAGAALYWTVSGIFSCLTSLYISLVLKPKIKEDIKKDMEENPIHFPKRKDVTTSVHTKQVTTAPTQKVRRNEGKQQKR